MPKRPINEHNKAQRQKSRGQKSFELVLPESTQEESDTEEATAVAVAEAEEITIAEVTEIENVDGSATIAAPIEPVAVAVMPKTDESTNTSTAPKGSAAARLAARRQANQKAQQRNASSLISPEHFSYVKRDLRRIAVLASIMFIAIIVLFILYGRTA